MSHTPDQARELWCPMSRVRAAGPHGAAGCNRKDSYGDSNCIANKCAMWRWDSVRLNATTDTEARYARASTGFCGLANAPGVFNG